MEFSPDTPKVGQNVRMSFIDCIIEATVVGRRALDDTPNEPSTAEWINLSDGNTVRRHEGGGMVYWTILETLSKPIPASLEIID